MLARSLSLSLSLSASLMACSCTITVYRYANGDVYEGEFSMDEFHGKGKYIGVNGITYEGDFSQGARVRTRSQYSRSLSLRSLTQAHACRLDKACARCATATNTLAASSTASSKAKEVRHQSRKAIMAWLGGAVTHHAPIRTEYTFAVGGGMRGTFAAGKPVAVENFQ